jgi:hypothetical protein
MNFRPIKAALNALLDLDEAHLDTIRADYKRKGTFGMRTKTCSSRAWARCWRWIITALINIRLRRDFAQEWAVSLRVKHSTPLGEVE